MTEITDKVPTKKVPTKILVLSYRGIDVYRDSMFFTVLEGNKRPTYYSNLESAIIELSQRLFHNKLTQRAQEGKSDLQSLINLVREHKEEIGQAFCI